MARAPSDDLRFRVLKALADGYIGAVWGEDIECDPVDRAGEDWRANAAPGSTARLILILRRRSSLTRPGFRPRWPVGGAERCRTAPGRQRLSRARYAFPA